MRSFVALLALLAVVSLTERNSLAAQPLSKDQFLKLLDSGNAAVERSPLDLGAEATIQQIIDSHKLNVSVGSVRKYIIEKQVRRYPWFKPSMYQVIYVRIGKYTHWLRYMYESDRECLFIVTEDLDGLSRVRRLTKESVPVEYCERFYGFSQDEFSLNAKPNDIPEFDPTTKTMKRGLNK
jgi:hypothetical protein